MHHLHGYNQSNLDLGNIFFALWCCSYAYISNCVHARILLSMRNRWLAGCLPTGISGIPDVRFVGSASIVTEEEGTVTVCAFSGQLTEESIPVNVSFSAASGTAQGTVDRCQPLSGVLSCQTSQLSRNQTDQISVFPPKNLHCILQKYVNSSVLGCWLVLAFSWYFWSLHWPLYMMASHIEQENKSRFECWVCS